MSITALHTLSVLRPLWRSFITATKPFWTSVRLYLPLSRGCFGVKNGHGIRDKSLLHYAMWRYRTAR